MIESGGILLAGQFSTNIKPSLSALEQARFFLSLFKQKKLNNSSE
jgi:hypothetical protein